MMNERLKMARQLLKEDGVIFVSIDDNEQAYLKVLMDEIFGEENFVACVPAILNPSGRQVNTNIALTHEYIVIYSKGDFLLSELENSYVEKELNEIYSKRNSDILNDNNGDYLIQYTLENQSKKFNINNRPNLYYPIYINVDNNIYYPTIYRTKNTVDELFPKKVNGIQYVWRWSKNKVEENQNELIIKCENNQFKIFPKKRRIGWIFKTFIKGKKFNNKSGNNLLKEIIHSEKFNTAKPIELIKLILRLHPNPNTRVLDFFAGSGTTGHAVLDLNKEDGGNRTFTLVTNNENNIGIDVCYERLYRINKGKGSKGETDFDWIKKNEPYNQNLDVFEIKYYDTDVLANNNEIIKQDFKNMLNDFDLSNVNKINEQEILLNLTALKPIEGKDSNESN